VTRRPAKPGAKRSPRSTRSSSSLSSEPRQQHRVDPALRLGTA
jgi:hypothetical protein